MFGIRRVGVVAAVVVVGALPLGLVAIGCGGDDNGGTVTPLDAGFDGTIDAAPDTSVADASTHDTSSPDSSTPDTSTIDADAALDAAPDVVDATADVAVDAIAIFGFPEQVAAAVCARFESCCGTIDASPPTEHFDTAACIQQYINFGYGGSSTGEGVLDGGHVAFDPTQASSCLSQIAAIDCAADLRTSTQEKNILSACFGAMTGTLDAGAPCQATLECAPGEFCDPTPDAGSRCAPLRGDGGICGDFGTTAFTTASQICSYRGSGNTGLTCQYANFATFTPFSDAAAWTCIPQEGLDASCLSNDNCQSMLCDPGPSFATYKCEGAETFIYGLACQTFIVDGGAD